MRKILIFIGALCVLPIQNAQNAEAGTEACVQQKFAVMKQVTTGNVSTLFRQHFDQESLVIAAAGGPVKWKGLSEAEKKAKREKLSDKNRLAQLAESFGAYKSAEITKVTATGTKAILIAKTHKGNKTVTMFFGKNCKITRMCSGGICVHNLF